MLISPCFMPGAILSTQYVLSQLVSIPTLRSRYHHLSSDLRPQLLVRYPMLLCTSRGKKSGQRFIILSTLREVERCIFELMKYGITVFILDEEIKAQRQRFGNLLRDTQPVRGRGRIQTLAACRQSLASQPLQCAVESRERSVL